MTKTTIGITAVAIFSAGMLAAAPAEKFTAYGLDAIWTNAGATVWVVDGAPRTSGGFPAISSSTSVNTDGSGKITGTGSMRIAYSTTGIPFSWFVIDVIGRVSSSDSKPNAAVVLTIKGSGYTADGTGAATLTSLNLKFTGAPGPNPLNPNQTRIVGILEGTIRGNTPLGEKSSRLNGLIAFISNSSSEQAELSFGALQSSKRILLFDSEWSGGGTVRTPTTYVMGLSGRGTGKGIRCNLTGALGTYTDHQTTNPIPFTAPISADLKGKALGQVISGSTTNIDASLILD